MEWHIALPSLALAARPEWVGRGHAACTHLNVLPWIQPSHFRYQTMCRGAKIATPSARHLFLQSTQTGMQIEKVDTHATHTKHTCTCYAIEDCAPISTFCRQSSRLAFQWRYFRLFQAAGRKMSIFMLFGCMSEACFCCRLAQQLHTSLERDTYVCHLRL